MNKNTTSRAKVESIANVQYHYRGYWFMADTMKFFRSKTYEPAARIEDTFYFISSEVGPDNVRRYTVRKLECNKDFYGEKIGEFIDSVGGFQQYSTLAQARKALNKIANW